MVPLRRALALTAGLLASAALILAAPLAASAHTPAVSASCSAVSVNLQFYSSSAEAPAPNSVTVIVDGSPVAVAQFGAAYVVSLPLGDETVAHSWSVVIDAVDNFDATFDGTSTPCAPVIPHDASAAVVVSAASCLSGEILALGSVSNATWGPVTTDEATGAYAVVATATSGHLFDDGMPQREFSGVLAGPLPPSAAECAPASDVATEVTEEADCDRAMVTTTTTTTTTGWVYDDQSAVWVPGEPVVVVTTAERSATEDECAVTQPRPGPPEEPTPPAEQPTPPAEQPTPPGEQPTPPAEQPAPPQARPGAHPVVDSAFQLPTLALPDDRTALPDHLAHNGTDPGLAILGAATLLGAGLALLRRGARRVG